MTDGPDLLADRNDTDGEAHGKTGLDSLLDDAADQEHEDTAGLIALDGLNRFHDLGNLGYLSPDGKPSILLGHGPLGLHSGLCQSAKLLRTARVLLSLIHI